jgi:hypothetical protein
VGGGGCAQTGHPLKLPHQQNLLGWVIFLLLARRGALPGRCSMYMSFLWNQPSWPKSRMAGTGKRALLVNSYLGMDEWTIKTPNPLSRLFFKIDLLTEFAALCLTDFIDWRYIHSLVGIFDPACELLPPWTKELYLCTVVLLPSLDLPPPPPLSLPKLNVQYIQTVCVWGGGGELCSYSSGILHSVSYQIQNLPNCFTTPNKMTSEDDIKGTVSRDFRLLVFFMNQFLPNPRVYH